jgi:hypothetical protein
VETLAIVLVLIGSSAGAYTFQKASIAALLCFTDRSASAREKGSRDPSLVYGEICRLMRKKTTESRRLQCTGATDMRVS